MAKAVVYSMAKEKVGEIDLPDSVFTAEVNKALLHEAVCAHASNSRQGTVRTKGRGEVRGGGRKPYRQKGTGMARHGSRRSPLFVGGGRAFGPRQRDWHIDMPKRQRREALRSALSLKNSLGGLFVVREWLSNDGKTSKMADVFDKWGLESYLIVTDKGDEKTTRSIRNIPHVKIMQDKDLNIYDLLRYKSLILTEAAVGNISERYV